MHRNARQRDGFSLIELLVTIVVLAIGLFGVTTMFLYGMSSRQYSQYSVIGTDAADQKLEQMRSAGYNAISSANFPSPFPVEGLPEGEGVVTWEPYPDAASNNQYKVTVEVSWRGGRRVSGRVVHETVISNRP